MSVVALSHNSVSSDMLRQQFVYRVYVWLAAKSSSSHMAHSIGMQAATVCNNTTVVSAQSNEVLLLYFAPRCCCCCSMRECIVQSAQV
jgi:hypothetical protein